MWVLCRLCVDESTQASFCPFACFWLCLWSKGWRDQKSEDVAVVLMWDMRVRGLRWKCHIVFMLVKFFKCKCFLKIVTVIYLHLIQYLKSNQLWIERTHMTIRMLSRLTLRKMRRMVASDTDCYGSTFVCMSFLISTLCVLCLLSAYYCRECSGYVMMGNDGTRTLKLAHSWEAVPFRKLIFCLPLA